MEAGAGASSSEPRTEVAMLEVSGFVRQFSREARVGPISFEVKEGEFFSLLGPSGCGKTTTLRAIAGFERVVVFAHSHRFRRLKLFRFLKLLRWSPAPPR